MPYSAAALLLLCVGLIGHMLGVLNQKSGIEMLIAKKVSTNHIKIKPLELYTASVAELSVFFDHLDFLPYISSVPHTPSPNSPITLLGARYCTLQRAIALQYRFMSANGKPATLYQSRYTQYRQW